MLILDKQKAIERIVALTDGHVPEAGPPPLERHGRAFRRIATFERRPAASPSATRRVRARGGALQQQGGAPIG